MIATSGHPLGAVESPSIESLGLAGRLGTMLPAVVEWMRLLAWPARLQADYGDIPRLPTAGVLHALGALGVAGALILAVTARRVAPAVTLGIAWCALALLPVSNVVPSRVWIAERTLFTPSIGWVIAVGAGSAWFLGRVPRARALLIGATVLLVALGVARGAVRHRQWNSGSLLVPGRGPAVEPVSPAPPATPP
jgi:hypothetical protein